jgi:hypothetical protein
MARSKDEFDGTQVPSTSSKSVAVTETGSADGWQSEEQTQVVDCVLGDRLYWGDRGSGCRSVDALLGRQITSLI